MSGAYLEASKKFGDNESGGYQEFQISIRDLMGKEHGFCFEPTDTFQDIVDCYREEAGYERVDLDFFRVQSGEEYELDFLAFSEGLNLVSHKVFYLGNPLTKICTAFRQRRGRSVQADRGQGC